MGFYGMMIHFSWNLPSGNDCCSLLLKKTIEIVHCPIKHGDLIHSYVKLPEGIFFSEKMVIGWCFDVFCKIFDGDWMTLRCGYFNTFNGEGLGRLIGFDGDWLDFVGSPQLSDMGLHPEHLGTNRGRRARGELVDSQGHRLDLPKSSETWRFSDDFGKFAGNMGRWCGCSPVRMGKGVFSVLGNFEGSCETWNCLVDFPCSNCLIHGKAGIFRGRGVWGVYHNISKTIQPYFGGYLYPHISINPIWLDVQ